jgi:hypothetical protein
MPAFLAREVRFSGCSLRIAERSFAKEFIAKLLEACACSESKKTLHNKGFDGGFRCSHKNLTV